MVRMSLYNIILDSQQNMVKGSILLSSEMHNIHAFLVC